jgi:hypothetical protein
MNKHLPLLLLLVLFAVTAFAQKPDTTANVKKTRAKDTLRSTKHDTTVTERAIIKPRKEKIYHPDSLHSPHTAMIRSLIIPGWGQIYNHKWWKVPLIYAGLGTVAYYMVWNNTYYQEYLVLSQYREHGDVVTPKNKYYTYYLQLNAAQVPDQSIYDETDYYRRNRDLLILGFVGGWAIQVIDAYIDAKFINAYSIDNNLSMNIKPSLLTQPAYAQNFTGSYIPGIKITFAFK